MTHRERIISKSIKKGYGNFKDRINFQIVNSHEPTEIPYYCYDSKTKFENIGRWNDIITDCEFWKALYGEQKIDYWLPLKSGSIQFDDTPRWVIEQMVYMLSTDREKIEEAMAHEL